MNILLRWSRAVAAAALMLTPTLSTSATAQPWPQRTVKLILPLGPGSAPDIAARLLADRLQKRWGQSIVVENRPGGDAIMAITTLIGANDDHTLLFGTSASFVAHPYLHAKMPYDPSALVPIARVTSALVTVVVPSALGVTSMADLAARARAEPGKLNYAAVTGLTDILFQSYLKSNNLSMVRVPYRDLVQALNDVAEGRVHVYYAAYATVRPQVEAGKVKILALNNASRVDMLSGIPTVRQAGFPQLEFDGALGLFGPRTIPVALRERIAGDVIAATREPEFTNRLAIAGLIVDPGTPDDFAAAIEQQHRRAEGAANILGLKRAN